MRFLFVDRITSRDGDTIRGERRFGGDEPLLIGGLAGGLRVAPGAVSEAVGQLASWLCLERRDFASRPVFLFADEIRVLAPVPAGSKVELSARIESMAEESFRFSGEARVDGTLVQEIRHCSGYFMALEEMEDPEITRRRFAALVDGGFEMPDRAGPRYPFESLAGEVVERTEGAFVTCARTFPADEPFYRDHFPRFPVTPIVILNEMIGRTAEHLFTLPGDGRLEVRLVKGIKIKSFVRPEEEVLVKVRLDEGTPVVGTRIQTTCELEKQGRRIMRGRYEFEVMG